MTTRHDVWLDPDLIDLKIATEKLVKANGGPSPAGVALAVDPKRVSECANRNTAVFMSIKNVAQLEDRTCTMPGHPHVTRALAARQGFLLVRVPQALDGGGAFSASVMTLTGHLGAVANGICHALRNDGEIDGDEADDIMRQLDELDADSAALRLMLQARRAACSTTKKGKRA